MKTRNRLLSSVLAAVLAASGVLAAGAVPASAAPTAPVNKYVALGDSYAAGQGGGDYLDACLQSPNGYPALLDSVKGVNLVRNVSCAQATTGDVNATQLSALNRGTTLVTLTVGGNDLNVAGIAAICTAGDALACSKTITDAAGRLPQLGSALASTYAQIAAAAPRAQVIVAGYPYLFEPSETDLRIDQINVATMLLNQTIQGAVDQAKANGANIKFVDVSGRFIGHGIGSQEPWINSTLPDAFHPNTDGYKAYAAAIQAALAR